MDIIRSKKNKIKEYREHFSETTKTDLNKEDEIRCQIYRFGQSLDLEDEIEVNENNFYSKKKSNEDNEFVHNLDVYNDFLEKQQISNFEKNKKNETNKKVFPKINLSLRLAAFSLVAAIFLFFGNIYIKKGLQTKQQVLGVSESAIENINGAVDNIKTKNFSMSAEKFNQAYKDFSQMADSLEGLGKGVISISRFIPGASKLSSGYYITQAGKDFSLVGEKISQTAQRMDSLKKGSSKDGEEKVSLLDVFSSLEKDLREIERNLNSAEENINKVKLEDIPEEKRDELLALKNKLPIVTEAVENFSKNSYLVADFLGANGPRKYLFLFQNNQEMRATGGFIGSYGVLDIDSTGRVRKFFIDGIFNPDGQLLDKVVPPKPIQKISVAWSLHDSNWFPDFPVSAKKAILFYEKTGGPTVDGVIAITPNVMQKLLGVIGPIEMSEYGVTLTEENFVENIQYEVEEDYDKEENRPKKILSDLAPIVMNKVINAEDPKILFAALDILNNSLEEKHVLFYFSNSELQEIVSKLGWSGEILDSSGDYLSVINTNINGYKTDGVIKEIINQQVDISENGEIINTVSITRKHTGGNYTHDWWNKVNSNYMRVYVPQGSTLLKVEGQTREINENVIDYASLKYEEDADVKNEEGQMTIDDKTGTRIYNEEGKTVFANWVYVSPQEEATIVYKYLLPFKMDKNNEANSYSLLNQKQSGSWGDEFNFSLNFPKTWKEAWKSEKLKECENANTEAKSFCLKDDLKVDNFLGIVLEHN